MMNNEIILDAQACNRAINNAVRAAYMEFGHYRPSTIWAVSRGGLVLAQYFAYRFDISNIKIFNMWDVKNTIYEFEGCKYDNLIVDDICDTGATFLRISKALESQDKEAVFASILKRAESRFRDVIYGQICFGEDYIKFPWDYSILDI